MSHTQQLQPLKSILLDGKLIDQIELHGSFKSFKAGEQILEPGKYIRHIPIVLQGSIRVYREDETGKELLMYFLNAGQTCATSLNCCMQQEKSQVKAEAESEVDLVLIPIDKMDEWMSQYPAWKNFVLNTYKHRIDELLSTVDSIAFSRLDERLISYLEQKATQKQTNRLEVTHGKIASDLGSTREVISRLLKKLENDGIVRLSRNQIELRSVPPKSYA